ncbi:MAG: hypothetical protein WCO60_16105 [Verrucomicrobiota bacterium]
MKPNTFTVVVNSHSTAIKREWLRVPEAVQISGMCRSSIYQLITSRAVKSFSHRKPGTKRGHRLISHKSLVNYLNAAAAAAELDQQT